MKGFKRSIALTMAIVLLMTVIATIPASAAEARFNNTEMTSENFFINDNGVATIAILYTGYEDLTDGALVTIELERKTLLWWSNVKTWTIGFNGWTNGTVETVQLSKKGEYRIFVQYQISGTGGADDVFSFYMYDEY